MDMNIKSTDDVVSSIFARIVAREIPVHIVYEDDDVLAFTDAAPTAPVHVLIIPKVAIRDLAALAQAPSHITTALMQAVIHVANLTGIATTGFRTVFNTGQDGGQTVPYLHVHVIGGRPLEWPPG